MRWNHFLVWDIDCQGNTLIRESSGAILRRVGLRKWKRSDNRGEGLVMRLSESRRKKKDVRKKLVKHNNH